MLGPLIHDDPDLPVATWVRSDGRTPPVDLIEAASLYVAWTRAVNEKVLGNGFGLPRRIVSHEDLLNGGHQTR